MSSDERLRAKYNELTREFCIQNMLDPDQEALNVYLMGLCARLSLEVEDLQAAVSRLLGDAK